MKTFTLLFGLLLLLSCSKEQTSILQGIDYSKIPLDKTIAVGIVPNGENLQDGVAGFGETPYKAVLDFNKHWYEK